MEKKNKTFKVVLFELLFLIVLLGCFGGIALLYINKIELEEQITKRDNLIRKKEISDSIIVAQSKTNKSTVEKYISDCGIFINNKKVSTDELLQFLNSKIDKISSLEGEIYRLKDSINNLGLRVNLETKSRNEYVRKFVSTYDSLIVYKSFYNLAKKNFNTDFKLNGKTLSISVPKDTLEIYKTLYEMAQSDYGVSYDITYDGKYRTFTRKINKIDSALMLYKYYKDKVTRDSSGKYWYIETPPMPKQKGRRH